MISRAVRDRLDLPGRGINPMVIAGGVHLAGVGTGDEGCVELLNITQPKRVAAMHERLLRSGATHLLTNTAGAAPQVLDKYRMHDEAFAVSYLGAEIAGRVAREAGKTGPRPWVIGDVRVPWHLPVHGYLTSVEVETAAASMASAQIAGGVDIIHLQASSHAAQMAAAFAGIRAGMAEAGRLVPIVASVGRGGGVPTLPTETRDAVSVAILAHSLGAVALSIDVEGVDGASVVPLEVLSQVTDAALFIAPGASEGTARAILGDPAIAPKVAFVSVDTPSEAWRLSRFVAAAAPRDISPGVNLAGEPMNENVFHPATSSTPRIGMAR